MKHLPHDLKRAAKLCRALAPILLQIGEDAMRRRAFGRLNKRFNDRMEHAADHLIDVYDDLTERAATLPCGKVPKTASRRLREQT